MEMRLLFEERGLSLLWSGNSGVYWIECWVTHRKSAQSQKMEQPFLATSVYPELHKNCHNRNRKAHLLEQMGWRQNADINQNPIFFLLSKRS